MWDIEGTGGGVKSIGVGGAMTGRGFHGIIVDDPIKNDMEARSPVFRERTWRWFNSTAYTRLEPDGWCIVIMTRWHDDDIVGRLLREQEEQGVNTWEVVNLPAIATASNTNPYEWREEGEPLWGERFSIGDLRRIEKQIGAYQFTALYQQRPVPEGDGDLNHTDLRMIRREALPPMVRLCRYWDLAFSEKAAADSIAGVLCGIDAQNNFYILHIEPLKMRWTRGMPRLMDRALLDPPLTRQIIESNGTQLGYYQEVKEHTRMRRTHVSNCNPVGTKEMRAGVWGSRLVDGIIFCVVDEWNDALFQQMDGFPNAAHDDMVDGVSGAWWHLMVGKGGAVHSAQ
jgi:predicted phage terminase large subunit-like protein